MTEKKTSTLPHVLQEYNPDYDPGSTLKSQSQHRCDGEKSSSSLHESKSRSLQHSPNRRLDHVSVTSARSGGRSATTSGRKSTARKSKKSDDQRYEELSDKWDQAKEEVRLEDHEVLREKVSLQQELISKQDEHAKQRRLQIAQAEAEKRESDRVKKQAKQEQLQQICKQSLEEDKKAQREERKATKSKTKNALSNISTSAIPPSPTKSPTTPTTPGGRRSNPFKMTLPAVAPTPDILDSDSEDEQNEQRESTPLQALPWHEQQLYKLYGKKADYFLHPKIENKLQEKKTNPKLRRQGGRAGAEALWQTLRQDSNQRLLREDDTIPEELKDAYGSFARQSLKKKRNPVRRMFCTEDDLPEMPRLLDNRRVQKVQKMRHKSDLMYRASVSNQDRTEVLTFNNPLPEFHERSEGVDQYLPSWQDDLSSDSTYLEYVKWLQPKGRTARENTIQEEVETEDQDKNKRPQVTQSLDDDMILILSRRQKPQSKQKYLFLSEKDTTVKGMFSEKYKGDRENKDIPRPYMGDVPKSYSALGGMISATPDASKSNSSLRYSAPLPTRNMLQHTYTSTWQPLSMHALVEYKKQMSTVGEGDFNLGRTRMWSHISVV